MAIPDERSATDDAGGAVRLERDGDQVVPHQGLGDGHGDRVTGAGVDLDLVYVATRNRVVFGSSDLEGLRAALDSH